MKMNQLQVLVQTLRGLKLSLTFYPTTEHKNTQLKNPGEKKLILKQEKV